MGTAHLLPFVQNFQFQSLEGFLVDGNHADSLIARYAALFQSLEGFLVDGNLSARRYC